MLTLAELDRMMAEFSKTAMAMSPVENWKPVMLSQFSFKMGYPAVYTSSAMASEALGPIEEWSEGFRLKVEAVLRRAVVLLRQGWMRGHTGSTDGQGSPVHWMAEGATRFCAVTAVFRAASELGLGVGSYAKMLLGQDSEILYPMAVETWNDLQPSVKPVLALFERTIRRVSVGK